MALPDRTTFIPELPDSVAFNVEEFGFWKTALQRAGSIRATIRSDSMVPLLGVGASVQVFPAPNPRALKRFDLIVFLSSEGVLFCHFVWNVSQWTPIVITKSLKNPREEDMPVPFENILGRLDHPKIRFWMAARVILANLF